MNERRADSSHLKGPSRKKNLHCAELDPATCELHVRSSTHSANLAADKHANFSQQLPTSFTPNLTRSLTHDWHVHVRASRVSILQKFPGLGAAFFPHLFQKPDRLNSWETISRATDAVLSQQPKRNLRRLATMCRVQNGRRQTS